MEQLAHRAVRISRVAFECLLDGLADRWQESLRQGGDKADDPEPVLDLYFQQCSIAVDCRDLAVMAASLANGGINPITGLQAIKRDYVENVLSVMATCGSVSSRRRSQASGAAAGTIAAAVAVTSVNAVAATIARCPFIPGALYAARR